LVRSIRRRPLTTFFVLAFGLTWVVWVPRAAGVPVGVVGQVWTWIPAVAALIAAAITGGRPALADLGSRLVRWRVGWRWYLVVILGPAVFSLPPEGPAKGLSSHVTSSLEVYCQPRRWRDVR
jgi:hypothetical protein